MEKIDCICKMRELCKAISELEESLAQTHGITLNEAMVMCCIGSDKVTAGDIAKAAGIKASHLSKILHSIENKGLVKRNFGDTDKRQVCFVLTPVATETLSRLKCTGIPIPSILAPFFSTK